MKISFEELESADLIVDCGNEDGEKCLEIIRNHYKNNPTDFEACAIDLIQKMDPNFEIKPTRSVKDGGRDEIGIYRISTGGKSNYPLEIDCSIEVKCYAKNNGVKVKEMYRLISRLRHR